MKYIYKKSNNATNHGKLLKEKTIMWVSLPNEMFGNICIKICYLKPVKNVKTVKMSEVYKNQTDHLNIYALIY